MSRLLPFALCSVLSAMPGKPLWQHKPPKHASAPKVCDPKNPAACDGVPSRCYCPNGTSCRCVSQ